MTNAGHYNKISSKVEIAVDQIRNRLRYVYENYEMLRGKVHEVREMVESGLLLYNSFQGPSKFLNVDPKKGIEVQSIIIAGRTRDDYEESKKRHDYEFNSRGVLKQKAHRSALFVIPLGLEPRTHTLKVYCSTN